MPSFNIDSYRRLTRNEGMISWWFLDNPEADELSKSYNKTKRRRFHKNETVSANSNILSTPFPLHGHENKTKKQ